MDAKAMTDDELRAAVRVLVQTMGRLPKHKTSGDEMFERLIDRHVELEQELENRGILEIWT